MDNNELYHHGVKGMKWYQHIFGDKSSGSSGAKKSGNDDKEGNESKKTTSSTSPSSRTKPVHSMSDEELKDAIGRLDLEKRYKDLMNSVNPPPSNRGKKFVEDVLEKAGKNIAVQFTAYELGTVTNKLAGKDIVDPKNIQKKK